MANHEHLAKLKEGVVAWDHWRLQNPEIQPDLRDADLSEISLSGGLIRNPDLKGPKYIKAGNFRNTDFSGASLPGASLFWSDFQGADFRSADLTHAHCMMADLSGANLCEANLRRAYFNGASLKNANLSNANLTEAVLLKTCLEGANLTSCRVFGISVWKVWLDGAIQSNLLVTDWDEPPIQVDNLEVAQFIYLLLNNEKVRGVIDTLTSKVVLILGRFTPDRKVVLDALRDDLRKRDYLPVLFDFEKPTSKDLTGTIFTLARE